MKKRRCLFSAILTIPVEESGTVSYTHLNLYMAYLAGIKENNGAATSLGRTATFLDIYIQRDMEAGILTAVSYTHLGGILVQLVG